MEIYIANMEFRLVAWQAASLLYGEIFMHSLVQNSSREYFPFTNGREYNLKLRDGLELLLGKSSIGPEPDHMTYVRNYRGNEE